MHKPSASDGCFGAMPKNRMIDRTQGPLPCLHCKLLKEQLALRLGPWVDQLVIHGLLQGVPHQGVLVHKLVGGPLPLREDHGRHLQVGPHRPAFLGHQTLHNLQHKKGSEREGCKTKCDIQGGCKIERGVAREHLLTER